MYVWIPVMRPYRNMYGTLNYRAQDRPDLSVAARVMSQYMSKPREGIVPVVKRAMRVPSMSSLRLEQSHREVRDQRVEQ